MTELKRTPLFDVYKEYGGKTIDFGGWELPVQFSSIKEEHEAVRTRAGLFDVSHMGEIEVKGPGSLAYLQKMMTNDVSKLVCTTASGAAGVEDGTNTWVKIATFSTGTNEYSEAQILLSVANTSSGNHDTAVVSVFFRTNSTNSDPVVDVRIVAKGGNGYSIANDSFKVISGGWSTDMELWLRKGAPYGRFRIYETSKSLSGGTLTYTTDPAWQSATPTGAVNNVSSNGVYSGLPLTVNGRVATSGLNDTNGNSILGLYAIGNAVNQFYITNQGTLNYPTFGVDGADTDIGITFAPKNNAPVRIYAPAGVTPTLDVGGPDANIDLNLRTQNSGVVKANGVPVVTQIVTPPANSNSSGVAGQIAYDANYFYQCIATNTWKRSALSTW